MISQIPGRKKASTRVARRVAALLVAGVVAIPVLAMLQLADGDLLYLSRVVGKGDASTDDYTWKSSKPVVASSPVPWQERDRCLEVGAAFSEGGLGTMEQYLAEGGAQSFVVIQNGRLVCEWYGNGGARDRPAMAFSVSKSVLALLVARAVEAREMSLDDPITTYVPELRKRDARFDSISIRSLLDMRSGIAFSEAVSFPWVNQDAPQVYYSSDILSTIIRRPQIVAPPGVFQYNDYAPNLVGLALQRATGKTLTEGPMQDLWHALGAQDDASWSVDDHGFAWHESGLVATARDLARIGQLYLNDGLVQGEIVAPSTYVRTELAGTLAAPVEDFGGVRMGYENGWWRFPAGSGGSNLVAMGNFGQLVLVDPVANVVIVRLGTDQVRETNASIASRFARVSAAISGS